ncbi:DUF1156 domain-containing protein [Thermoleptolyngbya sichuanensis A183]|uniref:DUF1156 domain-containing protein n=1 Tax=Thermoleptolyngbya sichuanensis A183 TaxID=2737172 RepID=A0A6M8BD39_9CYAN|nr:DUF1156 domain-containing protein [Thermoleptolyngbya sichuanensis]QKD82777.1 DUF1156 domain-containing protein [Thermoleptolyngbya sichuanensis A183]
MPHRKKLIEVALPLEAINLESAREKSIRHGHPSTLHLWWARRPLAACRAVLWASLVDDPGSWPDKFPSEADQMRERQRLFNILGRIETETDKKGNTKQVVRGLVSWDDVNDPNSGVLEAAQREIARCLAWERGEEPPTKPDAVRAYIVKYAPPAYDPFSGGGSIPLEAQRLGLEAHASDLNPVAVLINKALIEIPPKFKDKSPVNPEDRAKKSISSWRGAQGLAADVRFYGAWMRERAFEQIGYLYPKVRIGNHGGTEDTEKENLRDLCASVVNRNHGDTEGTEATVIAWLWARTVTCPNPACGCAMPLVRSFQLSTKKGKEAWVEPIVEDRNHGDTVVNKNHGDTEDTENLRDLCASVVNKNHGDTVVNKNHGDTEDTENLRDLCASVVNKNHGDTVVNKNHGDTEDTENLRDLCASVVPKIRFIVKSGQGKAPEDTVDRKGARCIACETPVPLEYVRQEGRAGRMGQQMMAIVAEGKSGRVYLSPDEYHVEVANSAQPTWKPEAELPDNTRDIRPQIYGLPTYGDLFTPRQLVALTTFSNLVGEARERATQDAIAAGLPDDDVPLNDGGTGARAYGEAIGTYLAFAVDKASDYWSGLCSWHSSGEKMRNTFGRQAIPMVWDYAECCPFSESTGNWMACIDWVWKVVEKSSSFTNGHATQHDATAPHPHDPTPKLISTDPPYYDNISYADLADFFYVWLRRSLSSIYPTICSTLLVPKAQELVATPYRFDGSKQKAQAFFEAGLGKAFNRMHEISHADYPLTVYYAFKQAETDQKGKSDESIASTGWETMLEGLIKADFTIDGTWPMRSELSNRMVASGTNALASSIVLVCRPRPADAPKITRRQFLSELKRELPAALKLLQQGNIAPVDLAQASIGPGMMVYSRYGAILESDGSPMPVRTALQLINQYLDEYLTEQEGEFDNDTRWALTWFEQHQFHPGDYGTAETLSKARNTSVSGMVEAGILEAKAGKVQLLKREDLPPGWNPATDQRMPHWEMMQHLIRALTNEGEQGAATLLATLSATQGDAVAVCRDLAYRLYSLCDRKGWSQEAVAYNSLVVAWPEISRLASALQASDSVQTRLL